MSMIFNRMLIIGTLCSMAFLALSAEKADAQLFPRLFGWRSASNFDPCCCPYGYGYSNYGYSTYGSGWGYDYGYSDANWNYGYTMPGNEYRTDAYGNVVTYSSPTYSGSADYQRGTMRGTMTAAPPGAYVPSPSEEEAGASDQRSTETYDRRTETRQRTFVSEPYPPPAGQPVRIQDNRIQDNRIQESRQQDRPALDPQRRPQTDPRADVMAHFASKLYLANHCEIEISSIAAEKATHPEVKQFAQTLLQEHQRLNQRLEGMVPTHVVMTFPVSRQGGLDPRGEQRRDIADARDRNQQLDRNRQQDQTDPTRAGDPQRTEQTRAARPSFDQPTDPTLQMISEIMQQAAKNKLEKAKEVLSNKQGEEFDKCFVGLQFAAHATLLAELEAMKDIGDSQFQQIVNEAAQMAQDHLNKAEELAKPMDPNRGQQIDRQPIDRTPDQGVPDRSN